jgi:hypothetical protein
LVHGRIRNYSFTFWVRRARVRLGGVPLASRLRQLLPSVSPHRVHLAVVVSGQIRQHAVQRPEQLPQHMDSFVAAHVQELATKDTLSAES